MAEQLQEHTTRRLLHSLLNIEVVTRSPMGKDQLEVYQEHTLIIVSEGQGWLQAGDRRFSLEKGAGFLIEAGSLNRIQAGEQGISWYRMEFRLIPAGHGRLGTGDKEHEKICSAPDIWTKPPVLTVCSAAGFHLL